MPIAWGPGQVDDFATKDFGADYAALLAGCQLFLSIFKGTKRAGHAEKP